MNPPRTDQSFVSGTISTSAGPVPRIEGTLSRRDFWQTAMVRWGFNRMGYTVDPGLYALGFPDEDSPVFVSANYKMSFDALRRAMSGRNAWLLVIDTKGVNVWCAAGKGTFGTEEMVNRIRVTGLEKVVKHRTLILPQLSGPGIAAHLVRKHSGFTVNYGPVRAEDLPEYLDCGMRASSVMRYKTFTLRERFVLIPVELMQALKAALVIAPLLFLAGGIGKIEGFWSGALNYGTFAAVSFLAAIFSGTVLTPILLPLIPGRAFSLKGLEMGIVTSAAIFLIRTESHAWSGHILEIASISLMVTAVTSYLAMNFTGSTTFTSLSGVKKEMKWALPLEIAMGGVGLALFFLFRVIA